MTDPPPYELMGWNPTLHNQNDLDQIDAIPFLPSLVADRPAPYRYPWNIAKTYNEGQHLPNTVQLSSDCVAAACAVVIANLDCIEHAPGNPKWTPHHAHIAWIYGVARVRIGGGRLHGPGATGLWGARAITEHGHARQNDPGINTYTANLSETWGERPGPPETWDPVAKRRIAKRLERCSNVAHVKAALLSGRMLTIASARGFQLEPTNFDGYNCFVPSGSWSHQMSLIAWIDAPFPAAYRQNTWGPSYHAPQLRGEPPGGAWNLAQDLEEELSWPETECYAYSVLAE